MIKTIHEYDPDAFDATINEFEKTHKVFATQTHVNRNEGMRTLFTAVIFYKE